MNLHKYLIAESFSIHEQFQHDVFFQICHFLGYFSLAGKKKTAFQKKNNGDQRNRLSALHVLLGHVFHVRCCLRQHGGPQLRGTQGSAGVAGRLCPSAGGCEPRPGSDIRNVLRLREETGRRERGGRQEGAGPTWIGAFCLSHFGSSSKYAHQRRPRSPTW